MFLGTDFKILCDIGNGKIIHCVIRDSSIKEINKFKIGNKIKLFYDPYNLRILKDE